ncbi:PREDICTED: fatty acyl-CoA reductase 1-like [Eufriesea mexicana]|uniref:fatty acyl-CoA reductase 1-like n=1 Tax=Eufriesea mexicana TaxID=516756 RepID=UPI00083C63D3|nr:PREDICTED: fatty acyl-CoA reductase 1-like [Eufriesea mexicana]
MNDGSKTGQPNDKRNSMNNCDSQIRQFYAGKHIFLTGCTGFLGTVAVEKILRTCKEISKIYIMIRQKKGKSVEERLKHFFKNDIFNKLREMNPNFMEKIEVIYGDLEKEDLGLSPEDRRRLVENVNIIIHNASMVHFVAKVSRILRTNVIATQKLLELARECRHLMAFVYVSTAYSHHYNQTIEEKFYPPPADLKLIKDLIRADEENAAGVTEEVVQSMVDKWINIYSFTKATTEDLVRNFARKTSLPCIVYRPSVVVGTYKEPIPWIGNKNGPVVLVMAVIEGYLHTLYWYENVNFDAIPADMTINSLLISIWDFVVYRKSNEPQVYNYGSSDWNPLNVFSGAVNIIDIAHKNPSTKAVWYPFFICANNFFIFFVLHTLCHILPSIFVDLSLLVRGKQPVITSILFKLTKNYKLLSYFISSNWVIKADKLKEVQRRMNTADLKEFPCDLSSVNWYECTETFVAAVRKIQNEPPNAVKFDSGDIYVFKHDLRHFLHRCCAYIEPNESSICEDWTN